MNTTIVKVRCTAKRQGLDNGAAGLVTNYASFQMIEPQPGETLISSYFDLATTNSDDISMYEVGKEYSITLSQPSQD